MKFSHPLMSDNFTKEDINAVIKLLKNRNNILTQSKYVQQFEKKWSDWLGVKYSVFVNSGSSANLLMYYSLLLSGKLKNNKVIVTAVSWSTSVAPANSNFGEFNLVTSLPLLPMY